MRPTFDVFFHAATRLDLPYDYQRRLAGGDTGTLYESQIGLIPTGLGTAAA